MKEDPFAITQDLVHVLELSYALVSNKSAFLKLLRSRHLPDSD